MSEPTRTNPMLDKLLQIGTKVVVNGYKGTVIGYYSTDLYEIRLKSGDICVDYDEIGLIDLSARG